MFSSFHTVFYKLKKGIKNDEVTAHQLKGSHEILKGSQSLDGTQNSEKGIQKQQFHLSSHIMTSLSWIFHTPHCLQGCLGKCVQKKVLMKIKIQKSPKNPQQKYLHGPK